MKNSIFASYPDNGLSLAETLAALRQLQRQRELLALFAGMALDESIFDGAVDITGTIA